MPENQILAPVAGAAVDDSGPPPLVTVPALEILDRKRSPHHALGRNVILKYAGELSRLFQLAFFVVAARRFGPAALGNLTVLLVTGSGVGLLLGDFGINTTIVAQMAGAPDFERRRMASEAFFWKNLLCLLSLGVMCAAMYLTRSSRSWLEIFAAALISLGGLWLEFWCALTNGVNRLDAEVWLRGAYRGIVYGGGCLVALVAGLKSDLEFMAVLTLLVAATAFWQLRERVIFLRVLIRPERGARLLKESTPVWVTQLAQLTYLKFDVVILGLLHVAARETGWYAAAWKIADVLTGVPALLAAAALPLISGALPETSVFAIAPKYLKAMYVLPFLFVLPLSIGASWITRLLYGESFAGTPRILEILVWAVAPIFVHTFLAIVAVATRRQAEAAKLAATTSILGMIVALLAVPRFGYEAMAVVCLVANSVFACAMIYKFRNVTGGTQWTVAARSVASALGVYGFCSLLGSGMCPALVVAGGTAVYCLSMMLLGVITVQELHGGLRLVESLLGNRPANKAIPA